MQASTYTQLREHIAMYAHPGFAFAHYIVMLIWAYMGTHIEEQHSMGFPNTLSHFKLFRCVLASLYEALSVRQSICPSIHPSVRPLVRPSVRW